MQAITTIGLDIAKSVFQVHGVDAGCKVVLRQQLKRARVLTFFRKLPPCLIGMEACASSHYWSLSLVDVMGLIGLIWSFVSFYIGYLWYKEGVSTAEQFPASAAA